MNQATGEEFVEREKVEVMVHVYRSKSGDVEEFCAAEGVLAFVKVRGVLMLLM
jgi:hypothetical protein